MLVDLPERSYSNSSPNDTHHLDILNVISHGRGPLIKKIQTGVYEMSNWNPEFLFDMTNVYKDIIGPIFSKDHVDFYKRISEEKFLDRYEDMDWDLIHSCNKIQPPSEDDWYKPAIISEYGVVDSPEQLLSLYDFENDPRKFFITMVEIRKERQPRTGGWRWHKWGSYFGSQKPEFEYLADEKNIESVWTFHIYEVK